MQESYSERLATYTDPKSCGYDGNVISEALTGVHAGWVLSRESLYVTAQSADAVETVGRQHQTYRYRKICLNSARSKTPCTYGNSMHRNWDIPCSTLNNNDKVRAVNPKGAMQ